MRKLSTVSPITSSILTPAAKRFADLNRQWAIISGAWLHSNGRAANGPPETWAKLRYRFENGQQATLGEDDRKALSAAGIEPLWIGDRRIAQGPSQ